jgi:ATP-dependent DNA helicase RecQ
MPKPARKSPKRPRAAQPLPPVLTEGPPQATLVEALAKGRDAALMLPSGGPFGWLEAAVQQTRQRALLVVPSELVAEREARLRARVSIVRLEALLRPVERPSAFAWAAARGPLVVLSDPETLVGADVQAILSRVRPDFVVLEQAQRASAHAADYDPIFTSLARVFDRLGPVQRVLILGPATARARDQAAAKFGLRDPVLIAATACPAGVTLEVVRTERGDAALADRIASLPRPGVVFCATAQDADLAYAELRARRVPVHRYHAAMSAGERGAELIQFTLPGRRAVLVATSAFSPAQPGCADAATRGFGLGFEERELKFVAHWQPPASLEQYVREVGLAARANTRTCVLAYDPIARRVAEAELRAVHPSAQVVQACALALAEQGAAGYTTLERLALSVRLGRRSAELAVAVLARAGLVKYGSGWVRMRLVGSAFVEGVAGLVRILDERHADNARRLDAVAQYATVSGCLATFLGRYFELEPTVPCGRCSGCLSAPALNRELHVRRAVGLTARGR